MAANARHKPLSAKDLIAAHRAAVKREAAAELAAKKIVHPDQLGITVPEIGPRAVVHDLAAFDRMVQDHMQRQGFDGLESMEFRQRMRGYRTVLEQLVALRDQWRKRMNMDAIEKDHSDAYDAVRSCQKALLARIKTHATDIPEIARYVATDEMAHTYNWVGRETLRVIASAKIGRVKA